MARASDLKLIWRLIQLAKPLRLHLAAILLLDLLTVPLALLTPVPLKVAVDSAIGNSPLPVFLRFLEPTGGDRRGEILVMVAVMVVAIAGLRQLVESASALLRAIAGERLVLSFRARLFRHAQRLSLLYHDTVGPTDSIYRIHWDVPAVQHVTIDGLMPLIASVVTLMGMIAVTATIDTTLALVALTVTPLLYLLIRWYRKPLRRRYSEMKEMETAALSVVQEVLSSLRVVKAFGREEDEHDRFLRRSDEGMQVRLRLALFQGGFDTLVGLCTALGTAAVLMFGVRHVQQGSLSLGQLLVVMAYLGMLYAPLRIISSKAADVQNSLAGADRAFSLLDAAPDVVESPTARPLDRAAGSVAFRNVSFGYTSERTILTDVSFSVPPGSRVGIAGPTGAGKTTLVSLLTRFYDPTEGGILLDGLDVREYKLADLRNQFSIVLQEPVLFSTSIRENIGYARPEASMHDIVEAARAANAHDFISALPDGYDTLVGERGMSLSGGERQRVSLARAFLKDAPVLVLDEPTSSVDTRTETLIIDAMQRLMHGRTTFMIAHRLSTLEGCDYRLELENGQVTDFRSERMLAPTALV